MQTPSTLYELFILGKLLHRPMHGYLLQSIVNAALGPFRKLSWGTLYPLLRRLEQNGMIAVQLGGTGSRGTKSYRTTPGGKERFVELMRGGSPHDDEFRDLFHVKLSNFGHIRKADRMKILTGHRVFLAALVTHFDAMAGAVLEAPGLAVTERPFVLQAIDHQRHLAASELKWVDSLIKSWGDPHETKYSYADAGSGYGHKRGKRRQ